VINFTAAPLLIAWPPCSLSAGLGTNSDDARGEEGEAVVARE
jgi:hypothetical protein